MDTHLAVAFRTSYILLVVCGSRRIVDVLCVLDAWYIARGLLLVFP
jgi:hypothetical protein